MNKHEKIFHRSAGMASPHYKAQTPFEMIGGMLKNTVKNIVNFFPDEGKMQREQDKKNRANAPVGAVGGTNTGEYKGN